MGPRGGARLAILCDPVLFVLDAEPLEFGHTLEDQLGGQCDAGFAIVGMCGDSWPDHPAGSRLPLFLATRALEPRA